MGKLNDVQIFKQTLKVLGFNPNQIDYALKNARWESQLENEIEEAIKNISNQKSEEKVAVKPLPTNLIVIDDDGQVYYSAQKIVKDQVVSVVDLFNNFTTDESKAFTAIVKSIDDTEIEFVESKMQKLELFDPSAKVIQGTLVRNTTEAIGVITNELQKEGFKMDEFEIHQEKHANGYYFVAFTSSSAGPEDIGSGDTYKWRLDKTSNRLIEEKDDKDEFYRDGSDIAENGKKINHQKLYQAKER